MIFDIEHQIINAFVIKRKKERALFELKDSEKRDNFIWDIEEYFDSRYVFQIEQHIASSQELYKILRAHGAPDMCYAMGIYAPDYDGKIIGLREALNLSFRRGPVLLSCIHGKLAYYEAHPQCVISPRYILARK